MNEPYLGHPLDPHQKQQEDQSRCAPSKPTVIQQITEKLPEYIDILFRVFVPSNKQAAFDTMIEIHGTASAVLQKENKYRQDVNYEFVRIDGRKEANPTDLKFQLAAENPVTAYLRGKSPDAKLKWAVTSNEKDHFSFTVDSPRNPVLANALIEILDKNDLVVGSFFAPAWVEAAPK
jgi:hypothetical protein